jgi:hypothetical protein
VPEDGTLLRPKSRPCLSIDRTGQFSTPLHYRGGLTLVSGAHEQFCDAAEEYESSRMAASLSNNELHKRSRKSRRADVDELLGLALRQQRENKRL